MPQNTQCPTIKQSASDQQKLSFGFDTNACRLAGS